MASNRLPWVHDNLWYTNWEDIIKASIVIPSLNRPKSLSRVLDSLAKQTEQDYETIIITEEGPLSECRNKGARRAKGDIVTFIDDDVWLSPDWLRSIVESFEEDGSRGGVSGPAVITDEHRRNRDIFSYRWAKLFYDKFFTPGQSHLPGHISRAGAWSTGACSENCDYEGEVDFLEACNMSFKREAFLEAGGFDEQYVGVGDWSEPDLCYRIRQAGFTLWFNPRASLLHEPSQSGAFKKRKKDAPNRLQNYLLFSKRWIKPCLKHSLYKLFIRGYYATKTIGR